MIEAGSHSTFGIKMETKDWVVLLPTLASGLAITYELGSFLPLGTRAFGLFSLTDHLLWALQVVPYSILLIGVALIGNIYSRAYFQRRKAAASFQRPRRGWTAFVFSLIFAVVWLSLGVMLPSATVLTIGLAALAIVFTPTTDAGKQAAKVLIGLFILGVSFSLGVDSTRRFLNHGKPAQFQFSNGDVKKLLLVRSGDKLTLLFDKEPGQFLLIKLDELKSIAWDRTPVRPGLFVGP
jgi:hypothetical protein